MGINGLLPKLASVTEAVTLEALAHLRVAVDAYVWLHRASYACARELVQGVPTDRFVHYCMNLVRMLQHYQIRPVLVFDGAPLPTKLGTEHGRHLKREASKQQALQFLAQGNAAAAEECFQRAVSITPRMAHRFIQALKQAGIEYIVAPYEADAQLAYLSISGYVDAVITEDSDLLAYGATRVVFKLDKYGNGKQIRQERLSTASEMDLTTFTQTNFRHMCILSGCDYVSNVAGIGMARAHKLVHKFRDPAKIFKALRLDANVDFPPNYPEHFRRADLTFQHQCVYDPNTQRLIPLNPFPPHVEVAALQFIGAFYDDALAVRVCTGEVDPVTYEPFEDDALNSGKSSTPLTKTPTDTVKSHSLAKYFQRNQSDGAVSMLASTDRGIAQGSHAVIAPDTPPQQRSVKRVLVRSKFWSDTQASSQDHGAMLIRTKNQVMRKEDVVVRRLHEDFEASEKVLDDLFSTPKSPRSSPERMREHFIPAPPSVVPKTFLSPVVKRGRLTVRAHIDLTEVHEVDSGNESNQEGEHARMDVEEVRSSAEDCENKTPTPEADECVVRTEDSAHESDLDLAWTSRLLSLQRTVSPAATPMLSCATSTSSPQRSRRATGRSTELSDEEERMPLSLKRKTRLLDCFIVPSSPSETEMCASGKKRARPRSLSPPSKVARTLADDLDDTQATLALTRSAACDIDEDSLRPLKLMARFAFKLGSSAGSPS